MSRLAWAVGPWHLVVLVLVFVALPLLVLGEIVASDSRSRLEQAERLAAADAATRAGDLLASRLSALTDGVFGVAQSAELGAAADEWTPSETGGAQRLLETYRSAMSSDIERLLLLDQRGGVFARYPSNEAEPPGTDYLPQGLTGNFQFPRVVRVVTHSSQPPGLMVSTTVRRARIQTGLVAEVPLARIAEWLTPLLSAAREIHVRDERGRLIASAVADGAPPPLTEISDPASLARLPSDFVSVSSVKNVTWQVVAVRPPTALLALDDAAAVQRLLRTALLAMLAVAAYVVGAVAARLRRQQRELRDANIRIDAASAAKSRFLAAVSHDLRTPLNAILGFSDILLQRLFGALNEKQDEYLRDIRSAGEHQLSLVNDLLDLSKIEAGKMELNPVPFSLRELLQQAHAVIAPMAQAKHLRLELEIAPEMPTVEHDPARLRQVVLNLLSNAVKFTPEGGEVRTVAEAHDAVFTVAVSDTGVGIGAEDQARVFVEFQQVGASARSGQGTGLGLALVRGLAHMMGGDVTLRSSLGDGSTFTVTLPLQRSTG